MKRCYSCKQELSVELFGKNSTKLDGLSDACRPCKKILDKNYRELNKEKCKEKAKLYYENNREYIITKSCLYSKENRDALNISVNKRRLEIKTEVFSHYCNDEEPICKCCGEKDLIILTIDHINGSGSQHRLKTFGDKHACGKEMYRWLKNNNYPEGFQCLCMNCNYRKRFLEMQPENPSRRQITQATYIRNNKLKCLDNYGGRICSCGEDDIVVLTLDHVNDDGARHRKELNVRGSDFYKFLCKNNFPNDPPLQVLCMSCNFRKKYLAEQG